MDIKKWLEQTGLAVAETAFMKPPKLPYLVFMDSCTERGADGTNNLLEHELTLELYAERVDKSNEKNVEALLREKGLEFQKEISWIDSECFFQTAYTTNFLEKMEG